MRRLRVASRSGACAGGPNAVGTTVSDAGLLAAVDRTSQTQAKADGGTQEVDRAAVLGATASSDETKDGEPVLGAPAGATTPQPADESGGIVILWGIGLLMLAAGTIALLRRRRFARPGPLDVPASQLPPAPWDEPWRDD